MKNTTNKFLLAAVILLLIANIVLVAFMIWGNDKKPAARSGGRGGPFDKLVKEMGMSDQQQKQYQSLREAHFKNVRPLFDSMRLKRQALFNLLNEEPLNDSLVNSLTAYIAEKQIQADKLTLMHFRQVRLLLNQDQQQKFDAFIQKMMQRGRRDSANGKNKTE
jgi:Spy/CpxP family protein refolding chaperone